MNANKILIGGVTGGVVFFFLGWLIYGMLLMDYMQTNTNQSVMIPMDSMIWWALILGNLISGLLLAMIFSWSNISGVAAGAKTGAIVGLMIGLSVDLMFYSMSTWFSNLSAVFVDVIVGTIMAAIAGAVIGWVMGMGKAQA